jgi:Leucine-rich repeat (LRR) protein
MFISGVIGNREIEFDSLDKLYEYSHFDDIVTLYCKNVVVGKFKKFPAKLWTLHCTYCSLTELVDLPSTLYAIHCGYNELTVLNGLPQITELYCENNKITNIDNIPSSVLILNCDNNKIDKLDKLPSKLQTLRCSGNHIVDLDNLPSELYCLDCDESIDLNCAPASLSLVNGYIFNRVVSAPKNRSCVDKKPIECKCMISLVELIDTEYEECFYCNCHKPFLREPLIEWLKQQYTCPNCTRKWKWNPTYYKC